METAFYAVRHAFQGVNPLHLVYTVPALFVLSYLTVGLFSAFRSLRRLPR